MPAGAAVTRTPKLSFAVVAISPNTAPDPRLRGRDASLLPGRVWMRSTKTVTCGVVLPRGSSWNLSRRASLIWAPSNQHIVRLGVSLYDNYHHPPELFAKDER